MAQSFQFLYSNVCCALCIRGKKRRAAAAKQQRQERRQLEKMAGTATLMVASEKVSTSILDIGSVANGSERENCGMEGGLSYEASSGVGVCNQNVPARAPQ